MKIQIVIEHSEGKNKLILIDPSEAVQQLAIGKFFGYSREMNVSATLSVQNRNAGGGSF